MAKASKKRSTPPDERHARIRAALATVLAANPKLIDHFPHQTAEERETFKKIADRAISGARPKAATQQPAQARAKTPAKQWVPAEVARMKAAGEIPQRITDLAVMLAKRMEKAAKTDKTLKPVGAAHIKNKLRSWACWPIR
jgi:hypothetical protein